MLNSHGGDQTVDRSPHGVACTAAPPVESSRMFVRLGVHRLHLAASGQQAPHVGCVLLVPAPLQHLLHDNPHDSQIGALVEQPRQGTVDGGATAP